MPTVWPVPHACVQPYHKDSGGAGALAIKGRLHRAFSPISARRLAMLRPNKAETAVHS